MIFSYPGLTVPSALLQQITAGEGAGVIFFGDNISSEAQIASVIQRLRAAQRQSPVSSPLLRRADGSLEAPLRRCTTNETTAADRFGSTGPTCRAVAYRMLGSLAEADDEPELVAAVAAVRQAGLFEVAEGIYQVRGLDLSNMTIVEGDRGVIVIDPDLHRNCWDCWRNQLPQSAPPGRIRCHENVLPMPLCRAVARTFI